MKEKDNDNYVIYSVKHRQI